IVSFYLISYFGFTEIRKENTEIHKVLYFLFYRNLKNLKVFIYKSFNILSIFCVSLCNQLFSKNSFKDITISPTSPAPTTTTIWASEFKTELLSSSFETSFLFELDILSNKTCEVIPSIGSSLAGYISNKITSSNWDRLSANPSKKSLVLLNKCG